MPSSTRSEHEAIYTWLASGDEDTTVWPSEEILYQQLQWSTTGRQALADHPNLFLYSEESEFDALPYVLVDGRPEPDDEATYEDTRQYAEHAFNAYVTRATDALVFDTPRLNRQGLPYRDSDAYEDYLTGITEFFHGALHVPCPTFVAS